MPTSIGRRRVWLEERGVVILYDEVYMTDDEWVRLLISILRSLPSE